jgi:hypothetical protein
VRIRATEARLPNKLKEMLAEASRRRVFRTAGVYLVAVWGVSSGGVDVAGVFGIPEEYLRRSIFAAVGFLPVVVILAWMFDIGRGGIVRDSRDLRDQRRAEEHLASMPTMIGGDIGTGGVIVRWNGANGEQAMLYLDEFYVGRGAECRVRFYDPLVSRRHARVYSEGGVWYIEDLGSRNGTSVGGVQIEREPLSASNEVQVNDAGPYLRLDLVRPGVETRSALSTFPPGQPTAHVRTATANLVTSTRSMGQRE